MLLSPTDPRVASNDKVKLGWVLDDLLFKERRTGDALLLRLGLGYHLESKMMTKRALESILHVARPP
jgi:hypothetical protein